VRYSITLQFKCNFCIQTTLVACIFHVGYDYLRAKITKLGHVGREASRNTGCIFLVSAKTGHSNGWRPYSVVSLAKLS